MAAVIGFALVGCASSGAKIDAARLSEVRKGETTIAQVVRAFGRPSILSKNMDGTQTAIYMYVEGRSDAPGFVALMGALAGSSNADVDSATLSFDANGVLTGYRTTQARPREPAPAAVTAQHSAPSATPASAPAAKPARSEKKASAPAEDKPWSIQLHPSGYRENR